MRGRKGRKRGEVFFSRFFPEGEKKGQEKKIKKIETHRREEREPAQLRPPPRVPRHGLRPRALPVRLRGKPVVLFLLPFPGRAGGLCGPEREADGGGGGRGGEQSPPVPAAHPERARATGPRGRSALDSQEEGGRGGPALARSSSASLVRSEAEEEGAGEEAAEAAEAAAEAAAGNAFNPESADRSRAASPAEGAAAAASPSPSSAEDATTAAASAPPRLTASSPPCQTWNEGRAPTPHRSASEAAALPLPPPPPPAPLPLLAAFSPPPPPVSTTQSAPRNRRRSGLRREVGEERAEDAGVGGPGLFHFCFLRLEREEG